LFSLRHLLTTGDFASLTLSLNWDWSLYKSSQTLTRAARTSSGAPEEADDLPEVVKPPEPQPQPELAK